MAGLRVDGYVVEGSGENIFIGNFEFEFQMALMNRHMKPDIDTIFLTTGAAHFYTAARLVKEISSLGGSVTGLVPPHVEKRLREKFANTSD